MATIIPLPTTKNTPPLDAGAVAFVLACMPEYAELWAPILPGESFEDALTRREAARDIVDELLAEYTELAAEEVAA